jgi:hypothetical protein
MPSRFNLPHIDISPFASSQDYAGSSAFGNPCDRIREEHGRRLQNELRAVLALADASCPRRQARSSKLNCAEVQEPISLSKSARTSGLVPRRRTRGMTGQSPSSSRTVRAFEQIVEDYLNGQLTEDAGNPPNKAKVEAIEAFRTARLETVRFLA